MGVYHPRIKRDSAVGNSNGFLTGALRLDGREMAQTVNDTG